MAELVDLPAGRQARTTLNIFLMEYTVYALQSIKHNYIYVGQTSDFDDRFSRHNNGRERTTRFYRPFKMIITEKYSTRIDARQREKYLKSGCGKEWLKSLL
ncbi:MAG: GIY-YIG nuclease family protein [Patescibacteria group bacterium]